jgi:hypothetical protein
MAEVYAPAVAPVLKVEDWESLIAARPTD